MLFSDFRIFELELVGVKFLKKKRAIAERLAGHLLIHHQTRELWNIQEKETVRIWEAKCSWEIL